MGEDTFDFITRALVVVCVVTCAALLTIITTGFVSAVACF